MGVQQCCASFYLAGAGIIKRKTDRCDFPFRPFESLPGVWAIALFAIKVMIASAINLWNENIELFPVAIKCNTFRSIIFQTNIS